MTHNSIVATDAFWALIALIVFLIILYVLKIPSKLASKLDERANNISKDLEEARILKEEANQTLVECQKKCKEVQEEAKQLLERARREAQQIENDARKSTEKYIEQQRSLAKEKMQRALEEASKEVKNSAVEAIIQTAQAIIIQNLSAEKNEELVLASIKNIKKKLN